MGSRVGLAGSLSVAFLAMACARPVDPPTHSVVDSAGISVVTNLAQSRAAAELWILADTPLVDIGSGSESDIPLFRVTSVLPIGGSGGGGGGGGGVAVGLAAPPRALVFDASGTLLHALGAPGDGPGEFLAVGSVLELEDGTIGVWDPYRRRLGRFGPSGEHLDDLDLSAQAPESPGGAATSRPTSGYTHLMRSGDALVVFAEGAMGPGPETGGVYRPELPSSQLTLEGEHIGTYGTFPGMELVGPAGVPRPFGARTHGALLDDRLVVGTSASAEFRVMTPLGAVERIVRWPHEPRPVEGEIEARWNSFLEERPELAGLVSSLPRPETLPAYSDLITSDGEFVFVSDHPGPVGLLSLRRADDAPDALRPLVPIPARRWLVFTDEGALIASVETPRGFEPQRVVDLTMWGVFEDELGIESVRAYRIVRPAAH